MKKYVTREKRVCFPESCIYVTTRTINVVNGLVKLSNFICRSAREELCISLVRNMLEPTHKLNSLLPKKV